MGLDEDAQVLARTVLTRESAVYRAMHVPAGAFVCRILPRLPGQSRDSHVRWREHGRVRLAVGHARADGLDGSREAREDGDGLVEWEHVGKEGCAGGLVEGVRHVRGGGVVEVQDFLVGGGSGGSAAGGDAVSEEEWV